MLALNTSNTIDDLRGKYFQIDSIEQADLYIDKLEKESSAEAKGYRAALNFTKSRLYKFPLKKMKYFKRGKSILEDTIEENRNNLELRYLRYCIQKKVPEFLNYSDQIEQDLALIINEISKSDMSDNTKSIILTNILTVNDLSGKDKLDLETLLNNL